MEVLLKTFIFFNALLCLVSFSVQSSELFHSFRLREQNNFYGKLAGLVVAIGNDIAWKYKNNKTLITRLTFHLLERIPFRKILIHWRSKRVWKRQITKMSINLCSRQTTALLSKKIRVKASAYSNYVLVVLAENCCYKEKKTKTYSRHAWEWVLTQNFWNNKTEKELVWSTKARNIEIFIGKHSPLKIFFKKIYLFSASTSTTDSLLISLLII